MTMVCRLAIGLFVLSLLMSCRQPDARFPHDAYIWQRVWTPTVTQAMHDSAGDIRTWRVLAAQTDRNGRLQVFQPERKALQASGKPVVLVVRIDGQLAHWDESALLADTRALWQDWQGSGVRVAGLEIDHDCSTARLAEYARYLADLRPMLNGSMLSITALPAWMSSADLATVLAQVDESVLQVHAVRDPRAGMFDGVLSLQWAADYAKHSDKPFRIALPDYGSRVSWDDQGRLASVQSEATVLDSGDDSRELLAMPAQIADFLAQLRRDPPPHLVGIVWFRLPTSQDSRAWSLATWLAVIRQQPLRTALIAATQTSSTPGTLDLLLSNPGDVDAPLPARIMLPANCKLADGVNGYALRARRETLGLQRLQPGLLQAHRQRVIGWARCGATGVELDVQA